jgi:hypothetical protein
MNTKQLHVGFTAKKISKIGTTKMLSVFETGIILCMEDADLMTVLIFSLIPEIINFSLLMNVCYK